MILKKIRKKIPKSEKRYIFAPSSSEKEANKYVNKNINIISL